MPGEKAWPTQPFPTKPPPFARQKFTVDDLSPYLSPQDRARFRDEILSARNEGLFTPPAPPRHHQMPGNNGGANWGGAAVDPDAWRAVRGVQGSAGHPQAGARTVNPARKIPATLRQRLRLHDRERRALAIAPPWTSLTAYDLNQGTIKWKIPLGEVPELAAKGIKNTGSHYPKVGPVVTAGGLIFTGTRDRKVRAFDVETGKVLWEKELDAALEGMPAVYEIAGTRVHRLLRLRAGRPDAGHAAPHPRRLRSIRPAGAMSGTDDRLLSSVNCLVPQAVSPVHRDHFAASCASFQPFRERNSAPFDDRPHRQSTLDARTQMSDHSIVNGAEFERRIRRLAGGRRSHVNSWPTREREAMAVCISVKNSPPSRIERQRSAATSLSRCAGT